MPYDGIILHIGKGIIMFVKAIITYIDWCLLTHNQALLEYQMILETFYTDSWVANNSWLALHEKKSYGIYAKMKDLDQSAHCLIQSPPH